MVNGENLLIKIISNTMIERWFYPKRYWQRKLINYIKIVEPEKLKYNPTLIEVKNNKVYFGMKKHYGRLVIDKNKLK